MFPRELDVAVSSNHEDTGTNKLPRQKLQQQEGRLVGPEEVFQDDDDGLPLNHRILTNLGTFRAYIAAYLEANAKLRKDMTFMVRQLPPSPDGLPLEIYVFTNDTKWVNYEGIQADIFDHLLAAMSYFDLRVFQHPTGHDLHRLQQRSKAANPPDGVLP